MLFFTLMDFMDSSKSENEWYNQDQSEVQIKDSFMDSFIMVLFWLLWRGYSFWTWFKIYGWSDLLWKKIHACYFHHINFNQRDIIFYDETHTWKFCFASCE